jgi:predicted transcriptional regulator YheO
MSQAAVSSGPARISAADREADALLRSVEPLVAGIQATFGRMCEVVLHDFRQEDHSVVALAGDVTHRQIGSPMSEIGLSLVRLRDSAEDKLNYVTRLPDGRVMKSTTMLLRTGKGHVIGALCINLDVTELRMMNIMMSELTGESDDAQEPTTTVFGSDIEVVIDAVLADIEAQLGRPLTHLPPAEWMAVFRTIDERGIFQIRRAVPLIAARLGLSRASVYNYISRLRAE